jgi:hypothetical protein
MVCFQIKIPILEKFSGSQIGKCCYVLWPFGLFYGYLGYFMAIWLIFSGFGVMHQKIWQPWYQH